MSISNYKLTKISSFLSNDIYNIPRYQRGYSWEEDQLEDFWTDLIELNKKRNQNDKEAIYHFLGQVVVHKDGKEKYIIDGQQRISTSVIFLDIMRTIFNEIFDQNKSEDARDNASDINANYIGRISETKKNPKLVMGELDKEFFFENIQRSGEIPYEKLKTKKLSISNSNILFASKYFNDKLREYLNGTSLKNKTNKLNELYLSFIENFQVMAVETDDINEAYIIFETLNARGKELETADLLKNHVLRTAARGGDEEKVWNKIVENLDGNELSKLIRYFWNSKYEFTREKDLYKALRAEINTSQKVSIMLKELTNLSELYLALSRPEDNKYFTESMLNHRINEVSKLKSTLFYPIIFALSRKKYSDRDIDEILDSIESLVVRNIIIPGKSANKYEIEFSKIAKDISEKNLIQKKDIINKITYLTIEDDIFINDFKAFSSKRTDVIRYILRKLNNVNNQETKIIDDGKTVNIEHILPKKIQKGQWDGFSLEEHDEYLWKIGNLTLLGQEYNTKASNKEFLAKKEMYSQSKIEITKKLTEYNSWAKTDILNRQNEFSDLAINIWKKN